HKKLTAAPRTSGDLAILADGQSTDANNRDKVLKAANPNSVALQYKSIIGMKRAERAELVRGMEVVYIYHNKVDDASHTADDQVFPACEEAIGEIKNLVRIILNEFGGTQVYITADHGFLYTYSPLKEDAKVDGTLQNAVEVGRRYVLASKDADAGYLLPVRLLDGQSDYAAFAPRENVRIRKSGAGMNFVHGGISLQEMVVPLIDLHYLRSNTKAYQNNRDRYDTKPVELALLSSARKVSNMIFSLDFYQKDPVGGNRTAATYELYFTDAVGAKVSDTVTVIADKIAADAQERKFRCAFHMKQMKFDRTQQYYLVIADKSGLSLPTREQFQVDLAFAFDDFGFDI
ncbi:MAG: PglZ domain-containing protein, partial [Oscillospiraceae bacterium]|nr:PglZ domain-containing protein [Oscillospiraceae bacterium]